jgi:protein O-GlcNAc transferase
MHLCDWSDYDDDCSHLISSIWNGIAASAPFHFLGISKKPEDQAKCTRLWTSQKFPPFGEAIFDSKSHKHDRIRIAYVSADFHQHATSCLMAGMFECHDRSQFEITAISMGPDDASEMRRRLKQSFDNFIDIKASADQIVSQIKQNEIDIAVDLKGFTQDACPGIFAQRCAPIQVNYLGYPGTLGASYIDYLIADRILIPERCQNHYAEKIVYLPNSYQVNDSRRVISDRTFTRAAAGLPEHGFVFCCFNNNYKTTPDRFDCWMRILKRVEDSVLWLLEANVTAASNLRKQAIASDIDPQRLVFAKRMPMADHLARQRLADLFLDTLPCNAHTTASDALWAGLPVLTQVGETFAGRVAASLLNAIGLHELITSTPQAYEDLAIELALSSEKLAHLKQKLADNRLTTPLFDTRLFTQHIEAAYTAMYERYQAGLPRDHLYVPK